jgi:hypothetical protein
VGELVRAVLTGGTEVVEMRHTDDAPPVEVPATMHVRGSGHPDATIPPLGPLQVSPSSTDGWPTVIRSGTVEARVLRVLDQDLDPGATATLDGSWADRSAPCRLATVDVGDGGFTTAR